MRSFYFVVSTVCFAVATFAGQHKSQAEECYFENSCENYGQVQMHDAWSGWRGGGYNREAWCQDVRKEFERVRGHPVEWVIVETDEETEEKFYRQFSYRYYCKAQARW